MNGPCGDNTGLVMGTGMSGVLQAMLPTNLQSNIVLTTYAGTDHLDGDRSSASLDPYIFVDPSVPNPSLYSVIVSDGVGNMAAPVPEPSAWMMTLAGMVMMTVMSRRRASGHQDAKKCSRANVHRPAP